MASNRHRTDEKPHSSDAEGIDVEAHYHGYLLPELFETVIELGIGRNPRSIRESKRGKRAWSSDTSKGLRPSFPALYEVVSPGQRNVTPERIRKTVEQLASLITYMEPNASEWNSVLYSAFSRHQEGGSIEDYNIQEFWEKFSGSVKFGAQFPLLVGPFYVDVTIGRTSSRLQSDVSFRSLSPPEVHIGGSIYVFGRSYFEETGVKSHVLSMKPVGDDFFSELHRSLLEANVEDSDWAHKPIWSSMESAPVAFILKRARDITEVKQKSKDVVNSFSYGGHFMSFLNSPINDDARRLQPRFVYATGPNRIGELSEVYRAPIICGHGYSSPDGSFEDFNRLAKSDYESGKCALVIGGFEDFCRTFGEHIDENKKWDVGYRKEVLRRAFQSIPPGTAMVSRCLNYSSGRLNLFVYCNGLLRDLSSAVIDREIADFFFVARKFDAALVSGILQLAPQPKPEDNFSWLCDCAVRSTTVLTT